MTTYTIQVLNTSGFAKSYVIFSELPKVTQSGANVQVFTNAWVTFNSIKNSGFDKLTYDDRIDAYWGVTPQQLDISVVASFGGFAPVNTAKEDGVTFTGSVPPGFSSVTPGIAISGAYQIKAQSDFNASNNYVFGMAKPTGSTPIPNPVATFLAEPNDTFEIIPVVKFYVADGSFTEGEIIDVKSFSTTPAEIDFTGLSQTTATVTQHPDGSFSVQYS